MKQITVQVIILLLFSWSSFAQVEFQAKTLAEISANTPVFVFVHDGFCGPCNKMENITFQDNIVSSVLNENFACLNWNVEDSRFAALSNKYDVKSYPSLLFLDGDHNLLNQHIGFLRAKDMSRVAKEVHGYIESNPINNTIISALSIQQSNELLARLSWLDSPEKSQLYDHMIIQLGDVDSLWSSYSDVVSVSAYKDIELDLLEKLIHYHKPVQVYSKRAMETVAKTYMRLSYIVSYRMDQAMKLADYPVYLKISKLKNELALTIGEATINANSTKQLEIDRLNYYKFNKLTDEYLHLADSLITAYILPYSPSEVNAVDKKEYEWIAKLLQRSELDNVKETASDNSIVSYKSQHKNGVKIASRLDEIANTILDMSTETESIKRALNYSTLSIQYASLPKYLVTIAKVQYKLGDKSSAIDTLLDAQNHLFYKSEKDNIDLLLMKYK